MQVKKQRDAGRSGVDTLEGDGPRKNSSCFSNIKIFLISECALMLAQGTVGAYLVSGPCGIAETRLPWGDIDTRSVSGSRLCALCSFLLYNRLLDTSALLQSTFTNVSQLCLECTSCTN